MSSKRKIEAQDYDSFDFYDKTATRVLNFEVINRNVRSNSGKNKSQTLITKAEEVFKETLPLRYEANETPQYLIIGIYLPIDCNNISEYQINEIKETSKSCYVKYDIRLNENALIFYLVSSSTGSVTTHVITETKTTLLITESNYSHVLSLKEGSDNGGIISRTISGFKN
jgi:hypothetical protein